MIVLTRFPWVCHFICKVLSHTLSHLMLKTTLWIRSVVTSKRNLITQEVYFKSSETEVLTLNIYWATSLLRSITAYAQGWPSRGPETWLWVWLPFHEPLLWGLCFLRGNVSSNYYPQTSWTWDLMERKEKVTLGEFKWNRHNLTFPCPHLSSSIWLYLDAEKNKRSISVTSLHRTLKHSWSKNNMILNYWNFVFLPFIKFYGFKMFSVFPLKNSRILSMRSILGILSHKSSAQEGIESEANSRFSAPSDRKDSVTWAELRLQPLLRSSQRLSIALLISPTQRKAQQSDARHGGMTRDEELGNSVILPRSQTP